MRGRKNRAPGFLMELGRLSSFFPQLHERLGVLHPSPATVRWQIDSSRGSTRLPRPKHKIQCSRSNARNRIPVKGPSCISPDSVVGCKVDGCTCAPGEQAGSGAGRHYHGGRPYADNIVRRPKSGGVSRQPRPLRRLLAKLYDDRRPQRMHSIRSTR